MNVNPYQSPEAPSTRRDISPRTRSRAPFVAFVLGAVPYHLFVWLLLSSTPVDRSAGALLLINTPVFAGWGIAVWLDRRHSTIWGIVACGVQFVIAAIMILRDIGDWQATVLVDGIIIIAIVAIVAVCWRHRPITEVLGEQSDAPKPPSGAF